MRVLLAMLGVAFVAACADSASNHDSFSGEASRMAEQQARQRCAAEGKRAELRHTYTNVDGSRRYELTDAAVTKVRRLWLSGEVLPPPVQQQPPLWLGYQGPRGAERAGRLGVRLLSLNRELLVPYQRGLTEAGHDPGSGCMGGLLEILLADDPDEARERVLPHYAHQVNSYRRAAVAGTGRPEPKEVTADRLREGMQSRGKIPGLAVLSVDEAIAHVQGAVADMPVNDIYVWASVAGMPDDLVQRHLELWLGPVRGGVSAALASS